MKQESLLFLCTGNSCRSQMAEAWARKIAPEIVPEITIQVQSAGLEDPAKANGTETEITASFDIVCL
ncbi:MAG: hypothetical protein GKR91_16900 [Pseudomonadales bacterium]|nr:hypothetical protein [Pseudomonadales bacterium]